MENEGALSWHQLVADSNWMYGNTLTKVPKAIHKPIGAMQVGATEHVRRGDVVWQVSDTKGCRISHQPMLHLLMFESAPGIQQLSGYAVRPDSGDPKV